MYEGVSRGSMRRLKLEWQRSETKKKRDFVRRGVILPTRRRSSCPSHEASRVRAGRFGYPPQTAGRRPLECRGCCEQISIQMKANVRLKALGKSFQDTDHIDPVGVRPSVLKPSQVLIMRCVARFSRVLRAKRNQCCHSRFSTNWD